MEEYDLDTDFLKSPYDTLKNHKIYALSDIGFKKFLMNKKNILNLEQRFTLKDIDLNNKMSSNNNNKVNSKLPVSMMKSNKSQLNIKTARHANPFRRDTEIKLYKDNSNAALKLKPQKSFESLYQIKQQKKLRKDQSTKPSLLCYPNLNSPNKTYSSSPFQRLNNTLFNTLYLSNQSNTPNKSNDINEIKSNEKSYYDLLSCENYKLLQTFTKATNKQYLLEKHLPQIHLGKRAIISNKPWI